eukprot:Hpha_TRINITY_DN15525_c5_g1::TRINITY_DN15525_c5_g1_i2::g.107388::m.107388
MEAKEAEASAPRVAEVELIELRRRLEAETQTVRRTLEAELEDLRRRVEAEVRRCGEKEDELARSARNEARLKAALRQAAREVKDQTALREQLGSELEVLQRQFDASEKRTDHRDAQVRELAEAAGRKEDEAEKLRGEVNAARQVIEDTKRMYEAKCTELSDVAVREQSAREELRSLKELSGADIASIKENHARELEARLKEVTTRADEMKAAIQEEYMRELAGERAKCSSMKADRKELTDRLAFAETQLEDAHREIHRLEEKVEQKRRDLRAAQKDIEEREEELTSVVAAEKALRRECSSRKEIEASAAREYTRKEAALSERIRALQEEAEESRQEAGKAAEIQKEAKKLAQRVERERAASRARSEQLQEAITHRETAERRASEAQDHALRAERDVEEMSRKTTGLETRIQELMTEVAELRGRGRLVQQFLNGGPLTVP